MAVHLAVQGFVGQSDYVAVAPEGGDDLELKTFGSRTMAQVKSRRDHLGPFTAGKAAAFIKKMWDAKGVTQKDNFLLVLESNVGQHRSKFPLLQDLASCPAIVMEMKGRDALSTLVTRTKILVLPDPRSSAIDLLSAWQGCTQFEAEIYFSDLLGLVGRISDDNGMLAPGGFREIARSDIQQRLDAMQPLLSSAVLEEALLGGYCEAVDFLTPDGDPLFYLGVDAQASHVAAGLVVERPELRLAVLAGLERQRNVLIYGASGSGKSALLWEAAYSSRHSIRWFQVRRAPLSSVQALMHLAYSRRATATAPIGFIIDDVGRGFSEGWTAMALETARNPGLLLLASVREEDRYPLVNNGRAAQVKVQGDNELAERVWRELLERGQTTWQGWKEPWRLATGHLLEYTHLLTQGHRLSETLHGQVSARINDVTRHDELDVLRIAACANSTGCSLDISQLAQSLCKLPSIVSHALTRLKDEHLLQDTGDGRLIGLHELRSTELLRLSHEFPPPLLATTAAIAVSLVPATELTRFLARTFPKLASGTESVLQALALRFRQTPSAALFTSILFGLDQANAYRIVRLWTESPEAQAIPKSSQGTPASLAIGDIEPPDIGPTIIATRRFTAIRSEVIATGLTALFFGIVTPNDLRRMLNDISDVRDLTSCVAALLGQVVSPQHLAEFSRLTPPLLVADFYDVVALLETAARIDRTLAIGWVNTVGQDAMFQRFFEHVAWCDAPILIHGEQGCEVRSNVWFVAPSAQVDINKEVVRTCEVLLAVTPMADVVSSVALGADGAIVTMLGGEYPVANKRIPRENLPAIAQVARNREWLAILNAHLATESYTAYLSKCLEHVHIINRNLKLLLDAQFRGQSDLISIEALDNAYENSLTLVAPQETQTMSEVKKWSRLQSILSSCASDLVRRFYALPDGAVTYLGWTDDLLRSISVARVEEPWEVLSIDSPKELDELFRIVEVLQKIAGEAHKRQRSPFVTHLRKTAAKGSAFDKAKQASRGYFEAEMLNLEAKLTIDLRSVHEGINVYLLADAEIPAVWPPADVLITIPLNTDGVLTIDIRESWPAFRALVEPGRKIVILPILQDLGLSNLAVSGFDTPLPVFDIEKAKLWCSLAGVRVAPLLSVNAFDRLTSPLAELQSIDAYWNIKMGRNRKEERTYQVASDALNNAIVDWNNLDLPNELREMGLNLIESGLRGELALAGSAARLVQGEATPTIQIIHSFLFTLTAYDCLNATSTTTG